LFVCLFLFVCLSVCLFVCFFVGLFGATSMIAAKQHKQKQTTNKNVMWQMNLTTNVST
jgi:hypothetical protein